MDAESNEKTDGDTYDVLSRYMRQGRRCDKNGTLIRGDIVRLDDHRARKADGSAQAPQPSPSSKPRQAGASRTGEILLFTGVQISRHPSQ